MKKILASIADYYKHIYQQMGKWGFLGLCAIIALLAAFFALNFGAHDGTLSTYNEQLEIINNEMRIIESKKNIFFMTDIFKCKFKISN